MLHVHWHVGKWREIGFDFDYAKNLIYHIKKLQRNQPAGAGKQIAFLCLFKSQSVSTFHALLKVFSYLICA